MSVRQILAKMAACVWTVLAVFSAVAHLDLLGIDVKLLWSNATPIRAKMMHYVLSSMIRTSATAFRIITDQDANSNTMIVFCLLYQSKQVLYCSSAKFKLCIYADN
jgi:hypothetical protein